MTKKIVGLVIFLVAVFGAIRLYYNLTDDFRLSNIKHDISPREEWNFPLSNNEIDQLSQILNQKFVYLGKGAQVYAFGSEDGKYVLKFFKFKHLKPSIFISLIPPIEPLEEFKQKNVARKLRKLEGVFQGHVNAYKYDKLHSGLLFLHLNPTENLPFNTELVDKIGRTIPVDLNPFVFIVQRQGETLRTTFSKILGYGDVNLAITRAGQILEMYVEEYKHHVYDRDHGISHNTGFINDLPFHLDVGKISYDPNQTEEFFKNDLKHVAYKMEEWVEKNFPEYSAAFKAGVQQKLKELL